MDDDARMSASNLRREHLVASGWRQASIFRPGQGFDLPAQWEFDSACDFLVVCTQSCTLVSDQLDKDPNAEILVGSPAEKNDWLASGRNFRTFHLEVIGVEGCTAIQCDINRRTFVPREQLFDGGLLYEATIPPEAARNFALWLGRSYMRPALPEALVTRIGPRDRKGSILHALEKVLKSKSGDSPYHEGVEGVYIQWKPDAELPENEQYNLSLLVLCRDKDTLESVDRALLDKLDGFLGGKIKDGVCLELGVSWTETTFVAALDHYRKLSELDYLSDPDELGASYDRE